MLVANSILGFTIHNKASRLAGVANTCSAPAEPPAAAAAAAAAPAAAAAAAQNRT